MTAPACPAVRPASPFLARLAELLAATDQFVSWWGEHRAWPANEPATIDPATLDDRR